MIVSVQFLSFPDRSYLDVFEYTEPLCVSAHLEKSEGQRWIEITPYLSMTNMNQVREFCLRTNRTIIHDDNEP